MVSTIWVGRPKIARIACAVLPRATPLAESGPAAVTMSAVARAAGASNGSVYHRFPERVRALSGTGQGAQPQPDSKAEGQDLADCSSSPRSSGSPIQLRKGSGMWIQKLDSR
ncbi:helix-turn-helix domain-containing protein [Nocardia sp. NPDC005746]|uniref:helix-turn-helix domain-containing protein n=1 Tax=Nocardia sp. NPDC005746 TaxID=3157062 RepID=UPI0033D755C2